MTGGCNRALLWAGQFVNTTGLMMLVPIMPFYLEAMGTSGMAETQTWAGMAIAAPALALTFTTPRWGRLGDRISRKWMVVRLAGAGRGDGRDGRGGHTADAGGRAAAAGHLWWCRRGVRRIRRLNRLGCKARLGAEQVLQPTAAGARAGPIAGGRS
ncbi:hypothetical protein ACWDKQ_34640 [Saccharopolyspora sp. NPDC000995]